MSATTLEGLYRTLTANFILSWLVSSGVMVAVVLSRLLPAEVETIAFMPLRKL